MRKIWTKNSKRSSLAASRTLAVLEDSALAADAASDSSNVRSLINPEYDGRLVRHSWANAILNANSSADISDASVRLHRLELRGSHLYVYKPPSLLAVRLFNVDLPLYPDTTLPSSAELATISPSVDLAGLSESAAAPGAKSVNLARASSSNSIRTSIYPASIVAGQLFQGDASVSGATLTNHTADAAAPSASMGHAQISLRHASYLGQSDLKPEVPLDAITYYLLRSPHPDLQFDSATNGFLPGSSVEALVHFFLFADPVTYAAAVRRLMTVLPLLPHFGNILNLIHSFLSAIQDGSIKDYTLHGVLDERIVLLLNHVDQNFGGFLLKADVAPHILKILESLTKFSKDSSALSIAAFKSAMLAKQQKFLDLTGNIPPGAENPLYDLDLTTFVNDVRLFDIVDAITKIDLHYFSEWNLSTDKSLLLYSSICESSRSDFFYKKNPLLFNSDTHIHYLARLFVHHLFTENPRASAEKRARILEKWIDLGCLLDKLGNMSSWLGISSIILSQPILRLTNVWSYVAEDYIKLLRNDWSPVLFELDRRQLVTSSESSSFAASSSTDSEAFLASKESYHIMAPRGLGKIYPKEKVIPFFGDLLVNNTQSANIAELEVVWKKINYSFDRWNEYLKNLYNSDEKIKYNQDVLRRYDSMGFIFSNESLNEVFYLGLDKDDKLVPQPVPSDGDQEDVTEENSISSEDLHAKLMRLLELNCDSITLETVMRYSLELEPSLPENYLKCPSHEGSLINVDRLKQNSSLLSFDSTSSLLILDESPELSSNHPSKSILASDRLPSFNNNYFEIKLLKYDDLGDTSKRATNREKHNVVIDNQLVFRLDDFTTDFESTPSPVASNIASEVMEGDDDGLGIDVDDILNSDKFKKFTIHEGDGTQVNARKHRSFGLVLSHSMANIQSHVPRYIPKYATVDKLVDLLLIDSRYFDEDHLLDLAEYRVVFMLNYSAFMTTNDLLERLAHRFVHSGNAVISVMKKKHMEQSGSFDPLTFGVYPNWDVDTSVNLAELQDVDYKLLLKIQVNILKALIVLIHNFFVSFTNDLRNKHIMIKLLKLYSNEILQWYNSNKIDKSLTPAFESLVNYYKRLKKLFVKKTYRPVEQSKFNHFLIHEFKFSNSLRDAPINRNLPNYKNVHKIEKFLIKFDKLWTVFYKGITPENWITVFKILENLFENHSLLNYNWQSLSTPDSQLRISNVFDYFETLYDADSKDLVYRKLPLVFRRLFRLYLKFRMYLKMQLCDPNITFEERVDRMKTILLMVKITRIKMRDSQFIFEGTTDEVPSCIETAITNVIYSPESRAISAFWIKAANSLSNTDVSKSYDDLKSLLPNSLDASDLATGAEPLLPCFGWIIQNLLEINRCPSFHRTAVNFNKRYLVFKLIRELSVEDSDGQDVLYDAKDFEFLLKLDDSLDRTIIPPPVGTSKPIFKAVLRKEFALMTGEARKRSLRTSKPSNNQALARKLSGTNIRRQSLNYKSNATSRFKISGLFGKSRSFGLNVNDRAVNYHDLPDPATVIDPKQRPALIVQLKDKKIFPVYLLPFCFKIDFDNNESIVIQLSNESDTKGWLNALNYANRHWYFSKSIAMRHDFSHVVFGIPLSMLCARDGGNAPLVLENIYKAIESEGLKDVGIYRISTSVSELNSLRQEIDTTGSLDFKLRHYDVHALTSCVKLYFRELPEALLTDEVIEMLYLLKRLAVGAEFTENDALQYRQVLEALPKENYGALKSLTGHLHRISQHREENKMSAANLATVVGPALTEASNLESLISNLGLMNYVLEKLIEHQPLIFNEVNMTNA